MKDEQKNFKLHKCINYGYVWTYNIDRVLDVLI